MVRTVLADMIVPNVFADYTVNRIQEKSALFQSGIVANLTEELRPLLGGSTVNMPFFNDLTGDDEVLDDTHNITIGGITTGQDTGVALYRGKAFGGSDLAADLAGGNDPMAVIADRFADFWVRKQQQILLATLAGSMGAATMSGNTLDITGVAGAGAVFDAESFIDATHLLGDAEGGLTGVMVHSNTYALMKKQDLIDFIQPSEGGDPIPVYQGRRVIVDDGMPVGTGGDAGEYTTFLFGPGAIGYGEGEPKYPVEFGRDSLTGSGYDYIVQRRRFVFHPRGVRWTPAGGVPARATPSNAELAGTGNWARVYPNKSIRIVVFRHRLAPV